MVLSWEDLDALFETTAFDRNSQTEREVVNIDAALGRQQGTFTEDPEMATATRLFESRIDPVLFEFPSQMEEGVQCIAEICVDRHPLAALGLRVNGKQADGHVAVEVHPDCARIEWSRLLDIRRAPIGRGFFFLDAVGQAVDE